jgi:DUF4097 and DUF4098 domain-containing protein YvlB
MNGARLITGGGSIFVGRSAGLVRASTGGGDVTLREVLGSAIVSTGAGDVRITVVDAAGEAHEIDVTSGRGAIVLELPATLDARLDLETAYTENHRSKTRIDSDFQLHTETTNEWDDSRGTPRRYVRASGVLGAGRGYVRVRTVNGNITVKKTR